MKLTQQIKLTGIILAGATLAGCKESGNADYIVKYNTDNTIVYTTLSDTTDLHIMKYDNSVSTYRRAYMYIRSGDTITGKKEILDIPMIVADDYFYGPIEHVNGNAPEWAKQRHYRDSILHKIKQKHK